MSGKTGTRGGERTFRAMPILLALALSTLCPRVLAQDSQWDSFDQGAPTRTQVSAAREKAGAALAAVPEPAGSGSVEERQKAILERRLSLLEELDALLVRRKELATAITDNPARLVELEAEIARLDGAAEPTPPDAPTTAGYQALEARGDALRAEVEAAQGLQDAANRRLSRATESLEAVSQRLAEARQRQADLERQLATAPTGSQERELLLLQRANAGLAARVAEQERLVLEEEGQGDGVLGEYRARNLAAAQRRLELHERERQLYEASLQAALRQDQARVEAELSAREAEAREAEDPFERFVARWELDVARSESSRADVEPFKIDVSTEISEQEQRLANDRKELERLRSDVEESGTSGAVGQAIRRVFGQLKLRRKAVGFAVKPYYDARAEEYTNRRFGIDQLLYELDERWRDETEEVLGPEGTPPEVALERKRIARRLRDDLRTSLQAERTALTEGINGLRQLRAVERERRRVLDELETFIHAKVFWIQDKPALTVSVLRRAPAEAARVSEWVRELSARVRRTAALTSPGRPLALLLLAVVLLPLVSVLIDRRMRRYVDGEPDTSGSTWRSVRIAAAASVRCALPAACFLALAAITPALELGEPLTSVSVRALEVLAVHAFLRSLGRIFFGSRGIAVRLAWMPPEPAEALKRFLRWVSVGVLVLVLPWSVLSAESLGIEVIPRILATAFGALVGAASCRWLSGGSAIADLVAGGSPTPQSIRIRKGWTAFLFVGVAAALALSLSGRDFAARAIGRSLAETVVALLVLSVLYRFVIQLMERAFLTPKKGGRGKRKSKEVELQESSASTTARRGQIRGIARAVFLLAGAWFIVTSWGLNDQVLGTMRTWHLYAAGVDPLDGTQLWVSASDVLFALAVMLATTWLLRHLPGIYELAIFPRFKLDRGLRYAIVTISRYGLFFLGGTAALGALQVDFSNLAWLVAAMGIGLGFGLQEIVSNFVCGIILLVERPIRVGDMVTVGDVVGKIDRINIRATTVLNLDRQEVIVPNRALIAQNVTNWTLASRVLRVIVHIGVAYGSDVRKVHEILLDVAGSDPDVLADPPLQVFFMNHGDSSLDFEIRVFIDDPDKRFFVTDRLNSEINRRLAEAGIQIPFPQRDVHIHPAADAGGPA